METTAQTRKKGFSLSVKMKMKILRYIVTCGFLAVVNYMTSPAYWWVLWVIAGWGLHLLFDMADHYFSEETSAAGRN